MLVITDLHPPLKKEKAVFEAFILWNRAIVVISERKGAESLLLSQLGLFAVQADSLKPLGKSVCRESYLSPSNQKTVLVTSTPDNNRKPGGLGTYPFVCKAG